MLDGEGSRHAAPEALPLLTQGKHRGGPRSGACLMEYVSVLAGDPQFTDEPRCTHPALAGLARLVNDHTAHDSARARLALLAPALIGTHTDDGRVAPAIALAALRAAGAVPLTRAQNARIDQHRSRLRERLARGRSRCAQARMCRALFGHESINDWLAVDTAVALGWRQVRRLPAPERDRWLFELLAAATGETRRLLEQRACRGDMAPISTAAAAGAGPNRSIRAVAR